MPFCYHGRASSTHFPSNTYLEAYSKMDEMRACATYDLATLTPVKHRTYSGQHLERKNRVCPTNYSIFSKLCRDKFRCRCLKTVTYWFATTINSFASICFGFRCTVAAIFTWDRKDRHSGEHKHNSETQKSRRGIPHTIGLLTAVNSHSTWSLQLSVEGLRELDRVFSSVLFQCVYWLRFICIFVIPQIDYLYLPSNKLGNLSVSVQLIASIST